MSHPEDVSKRWPDAMREGAVAVIFVSQRTIEDDDGYGRAGDEMMQAASAMPGFLGVDSVRGADGLGITVSYWADEAAAVAWRKEASHASTRDTGRARWYEWYRLAVTQTVRSYDWRKADGGRGEDPGLIIG